MSKKIPTVRPRNNPNEIPQEKFGRIAEFADVFNKDVGGMGRPVALATAIDDSWNECPGYRVENGMRVPLKHETGIDKPEPRGMQEAIDTGAEFSPEDCTHNCGKKGTVQPLGKDLMNWQCSACGQEYTA